MTFVHASDVPVKLAKKVGVLIKLYCPDTLAMHVGLAFETGGITRMAHLASHEALLCSPLREEKGYAWADCGWLQDPDYASSAEYIALFIKASLRNDKVPYGLDPDLDSFASQEFVARDPIQGLTCATYIAAVLRGAGIEVVDIATWRHRPEDDAWSEAVLEELQRRAPLRAAELAGQRARFRVRPDEMAFAVAEMSVPVSFDQAVAGATGVRAILLAGPLERMSPSV
ncbi:hypothetical protein FHR71_003973 [Methylobacterium sp. RAS18]|nr:hypothetical protein [Methylobacterium sp. RAS18]